MKILKSPQELPPSLQYTMAIEAWELKAQVARSVLAKSIKQEWLLPAEKLPPKNRINVINLARESRILSEREMEITETDATGLVDRMARGNLKAEEVLIAFAKRATIGHQLVSKPLRIVFSPTYNCNSSILRPNL
jgi:amidase